MAKAKKLASGNWRALVYDYTDVDGKRIYQSFTAETKAKTERLAATFRDEKKQKSRTSNITLSEAYTRYIANKSNIYSPSTLREYLNAQKRDLQNLMPIKLKMLTQEMIQQEINRESRTHAPKTVRNMHGLLSAVLYEFLPELRLRTKLPQKIKPNTPVPIEEEVKMLLEASKGTELYKAILLEAVGTLRRSEICALSKSKDITSNGIMVTKALVKDKDGKWVIKTTKTTAGQRFVSFPPEIIKLLLEDNGTDKVVNLCPGSITNAFRRLTEQVLGKRFKFHSLRHYSASVLHSLGLQKKYVMARGGWESEETLDRVYTHAMSDVEQQNDDIICQHFKDFGN